MVMIGPDNILYCFYYSVLLHDILFINKILSICTCVGPARVDRKDRQRVPSAGQQPVSPDQDLVEDDSSDDEGPILKGNCNK